MPTKQIKGSVTVPSDFKYSDGLIVGYANTPVVDRGNKDFRDLIPADIWLKGLQRFFLMGSQINLLHRPIFVAETAKVELRPGEGPLLYTRPTKQWVKGMIDDGVLSGYSIEYTLNDCDILPPQLGDSRPIRKFKDFTVERVSYVDTPMNQGSYFTWSGKMETKEYSYIFDKDNGRVVVEASDPEAFARLANLFDEGLKSASIPTADVKAIEFKLAADTEADERQTKRTITKKFGDFLSSLGIKYEEEAMVKDVMAEQLESVKAQLEVLAGKVSGLSLDEEALNGLKEQIATITAVVSPDGEEEKGVADRLADLETKQANGNAEVDAKFTAIEDSLNAIVAYLEKQGKGSTAIAPTGIKSAEQKVEDFWNGAVGIG